MPVYCKRGNTGKNFVNACYSAKVFRTRQTQRRTVLNQDPLPSAKFYANNSASAFSSEMSASQPYAAATAASRAACASDSHWGRAL